MPLPLAAIAPVALRYGLRYGPVALAAWGLARATHPGARDQRAEDALDRAPEGVTVPREAGQGGATARLRRTFRRAAGGPGIEIDLAALARVRLRRV